MALVNKRITELPERLSLQSDDFVAVDGVTGGTAKFKLNKVQVGIDATLSQQGEAADAKAVGDALKEKVGVETGKSLTTNDFTDADKSKLDGIEAQANKTIIDSTLMVAGQAADAKKVGDEITDLKDDLSDIFSNEAKDALLNCIAHIAIWDDGNGEEYYNALRSALYTYPKITAQFELNGHIICTDDTLNDLKQYLVVKYYESSASTGTTISANQYTLSGTIVAGTIPIIVTYNNLTCTLRVTVKDCRPTMTTINAKGIGLVTVDSDKEVVIAAATNTNRAVGVYSEGEHHLNYDNESATAYYPMPIPVGAKSVYMENMNTVKIGYNIFMMKWDNTRQKWIRYGDSMWRWVEEVAQQASANLTPAHFELPEQNSGEYYIAFAFANCTASYYSESWGYNCATVTTGPISDASLSILRPHFVFNV